MKQLAPAITLRKNNSEEVRVGLIEVERHARVDVRIFAARCGGKGDRCPTGQGVSLKADRIPELRAAIIRIEAEARRLGLLQVEGA